MIGCCHLKIITVCQESNLNGWNTKKIYNENDSLFGVVKVHCSFDFVVSSDFKGHNLQSDEAWSHSEDLGPMSGLIQVLPCVRVGHACRVTANNVEVGSSHHPSSAMPLNLCMSKKGELKRLEKNKYVISCLNEDRQTEYFNSRFTEHTII